MTTTRRGMTEEAADAAIDQARFAAAFAREMVIHRDASALVLNKPPGLATQG